AVPEWETVLMTVGFTGMAVGLAVGLPLYLRERWPGAFLGRVGDGGVAASGKVTAAMVVTAGLAVLWSQWALGGTVGLDPERRGLWDVDGRLLHAGSGMWALLGVWSAWVLTRGRPARVPRWVPMAVLFTASGSLFAWSAWKLPMALLHPGGYVTAEFTLVAVVQHALAVGAGVTFMAGVVRRV
ncbi:MAG TPA: hypothetical protein VHJ17_06915, partial [Thermomonospora sp.]|nr:hypothetical protein [Thermomonospora sp.]